MVEAERISVDNLHISNHLTEVLLQLNTSPFHPAPSFLKVLLIVLKPISEEREHR
ncbi:hypothetical protein LguiA_035750 [Lonicera macranthoides]